MFSDVGNARMLGFARQVRHSQAFDLLPLGHAIVAMQLLPETRTQDLSRSPTPLSSISSKSPARSDKQDAVTSLSVLVYEDPQVVDDNASESSSTYSFRLFDTPSAAPQRIRIASPDSEATFVPSRRPQNYYIASDPTVQQRAAFEAAAVTGEDIIRRSNMSMPGLAYRWRFIQQLYAVAASEAHDGLTGADGRDTVSQRRGRMGKKSRIRLRMRRQAAKEVQLAKLQAEKDKEAHLKEDKKAKENRKKQLKKREKERERKRVAEAGIPVEVGD
ncbi:hypothetical protein MRB53_038699 [Persea americana]|nr:hypothetical protein MRB53_038699 [Persea americana]